MIVKTDGSICGTNQNHNGHLPGPLKLNDGVEVDSRYVNVNVISYFIDCINEIISPGPSPHLPINDGFVDDVCTLLLETKVF